MINKSLHRVTGLSCLRVGDSLICNLRRPRDQENRVRYEANLVAFLGIVILHNSLTSAVDLGTRHVTY